MGMQTWNNTSITANATAKSHLSLEKCYFTNTIAVQICKILAYCTVLLLGWVGNTLLVIIVCKRKNLQRTVNYLIVNMAISDIVFSLAGIPIKLTQMMSGSFHWQVTGVLGTILCKIHRFSTLASLTVSLQSLVWISIDRFIAVVFPMKVRMIPSKYRAFAIASTWILALAVRSPFLMTTNLATHKNRTYCGQWDITSVFENKTAFVSYSLATEAIFLIAPLASIVILYLIIAVTLKRRSKYLARMSPQIHLQAYGKNARAVKMSLCMMSVYGTCFVPYLILSHGLSSALSCSLQHALFFFAVIMVYSSSTVNAIICFAFVRNFRLGLKEIFNNCFKNGKFSYNSDISSKYSQRVRKLFSNP